MILHIDMDAFFAAVEQRDDPSLRGKPVIIAGHYERSVVSTASYEARKFGIHSAMPVFMAKKKCRDLIIVPGDMEKYKRDSACIMEILSRFSPLVEPVSIDEAYVDVRGLERLIGTPEEVAVKIKAAILQRTNLTCSIGIAPVKFLSKIASDMNKPDGLTFLPENQVDAFIRDLPVGKVPGIGKTAMKQMDAMGIRTLGQIKSIPVSVLKSKFGKMGTRLHELSMGIDASEVTPGSVRKSISSETTLVHDMSAPSQIREILLDRAQIVGALLRKKKMRAGSVFIKLKFSDFTQITRSRKLDTPITSSTAIFNKAEALFETVRLKKKVRLAGVGVSHLTDADLPVQMTLLSGQQEDFSRWNHVDSAVDAISEKFGKSIIEKATLKTLSSRKNHHGR